MLSSSCKLLLLSLTMIFFSHAQRPFLVDFETSMQFSLKNPFNKHEDGLVKLCKEIYEKNNLGVSTPQKSPRIPKIIHLIWVGPHNRPPLFKKCLESIKKHLPDWECKIWTDSDIPGLKLANQHYYDEETNYGAKADILRYELLYRYGGVYLDVDFVLLQPLDILNHTYDFFTCLLPSDVKENIANGVIGSAPGHPILKECVESIKENRHKKKVVQRTGPRHLERAFKKVASVNNEGVIALPKSFFFPINYQKRGKLSTEQIQQLFRPETFAVHYWNGSWKAN